MRPRDLVRDLGGLGLYELAPRTLQRLPRASLVALADRLGDLVRQNSRADAAQMREEVVATFDPRDPDVVVRAAYRSRMLTELEVLRFPALGPANIDDTVLIEGRHHLDAALLHGRGAVAMLGHFGANLLVMPALGHRGVPMNQLSAPPTAWFGRRSDGRENFLWRRVQERRWALEQALPARLIDVFSFLRPAYDCLARNEVLGLAWDGGGGSRWVEVPLGRRVASVPTQPWQLARSTGALVVPCVVVHHPGDPHHRVVFDEPWPVPKSKDREADVQFAAARYAAWFSAWCERRPDHYAAYLLLRRRVRDDDARPFFA